MAGDLWTSGYRLVNQDPCTLIPKQGSMTHGTDTGLRMPEDSSRSLDRQVLNDWSVAPNSRPQKLRTFCPLLSMSTAQIILPLEKRIDANLYIKFFYILNTIYTLYSINCIEVLKKVFNLCLPVKRLVAIITRENNLNFSSFY